MVLLRAIRKRGANIVVEAHGEVLFMPTGDVTRWTNRFSHRVRNFSASFAPENKRPRWGHYGKPLKTTFTAKTRPQPGRMKVHAAVGSTAPHAYYVDQGTGVFAGSGPYEAKILPPWHRFHGSLYEHTWSPGGPQNPRVKPVFIKGQKGQFFFDAGLKRGFQSMRMRSFQVPDEGRITQALASFPTGLADFFGNTPNDQAFRASLAEWRLWRDAAFRRNEELGRGHHAGRKRSMVAAQRAAASKAVRDAARTRLQIKREAAATLRAAERRAEKQRKKLLAEKKKREQTAKDRQELANARALVQIRARARAKAQSLANKGYTGVRLEAIYNQYHTEVVGWILHYTDPNTNKTSQQRFHR